MDVLNETCHQLPESWCSLLSSRIDDILREVRIEFVCCSTIREPIRCGHFQTGERRIPQVDQYVENKEGLRVLCNLVFEAEEVQICFKI